jgi:hypothetical protein
MIVVHASLRLTALAQWNKPREAAASFSIGRQVTNRRPGCVNRA